MPNIHGFTIRPATAEDATIVRRLSELDSSAPPWGAVLIGEIAGVPAAALSLTDGRVVADPFRRTNHLVACLRLHADALRAYEETPSIAERLRAALRIARRERPAGVPA
jgi:hypothetical protein